MCDAMRSYLALLYDAQEPLRQRSETTFSSPYKLMKSNSMQDRKRLIANNCDILLDRVLLTPVMVGNSLQQWLRKRLFSLRDMTGCKDSPQNHCQRLFASVLYNRPIAFLLAKVEPPGNCSISSACKKANCCSCRRPDAHRPHPVYAPSCSKLLGTHHSVNRSSQNG